MQHPRPTQAPLLELVGVSKHYPGVLALDRVSFQAPEAGEVHVLFGENGAGKSTLISMHGRGPAAECRQVCGSAGGRWT